MTSEEGHPSTRLDDVVHQRVRLGVLAVLHEAGRADFGYLARVLDLTNGNLSRHLSVLEGAGLVRSEKTIEGKRPRTWVSLTPKGVRALRLEVESLRALVDGIRLPLDP